MNPNGANYNDKRYCVRQIILTNDLRLGYQKNLDVLEDVCNEGYAAGYRLHSMSQSTVDFRGFVGQAQIVCNLVFEKID